MSQEQYKPEGKQLPLEQGRLAEELEGGRLKIAAELRDAAKSDNSRGAFYQRPWVRKLAMLGALAGAGRMGYELRGPGEPVIPEKPVATATVKPPEQQKPSPAPKAEAPKPKAEAPKKEIKEAEPANLEQVVKLAYQKLAKIEHLKQREIHKYNPEAFDKASEEIQAALFEVYRFANKILRNPDSSEEDFKRASEITKILGDFLCVKRSRGSNLGGNIEEMRKTVAENPAASVAETLKLTEDALKTGNFKDFREGGFFWGGSLDAADEKWRAKGLIIIRIINFLGGISAPPTQEEK